MPGLTQPQLEQRRDGCGHLNLTAQEVAVGWHQARLRAVTGHRQRARVRHGHRDREQPDGLSYGEALHELHHRGGEPVPLEVGLAAGQQQERAAGPVLDGVQRDLGRHVVLVVVRREDEARSPTAVVDEQVVVESRHDRAGQRGQEVLAREPDSRPCVDHAGQRVQQHRSVELGQVRAQRVQGFRVRCHRVPPLGAVVTPCREQLSQPAQDSALDLLAS